MTDGVHHGMFQHAFQAHVLTPPRFVDGLQVRLIHIRQRQAPALKQVFHVTIGVGLDAGGLRRLVYSGIGLAELLTQPRHVAARCAQTMMKEGFQRFITGVRGGGKFHIRRLGATPDGKKLPHGFLMQKHQGASAPITVTGKIVYWHVPVLSPSSYRRNAEGGARHTGAHGLRVFVVMASACSMRSCALFLRDVLESGSNQETGTAIPVLHREGINLSQQILRHGDIDALRPL
jgi:hypothetical protein